MSLRELSRKQINRRCAIARKLLDGPRSLIPLSRIDDFGWLEPVLVIKQVTSSFSKDSSSYSIFVDNTINRDNKFLTPIVRYAFWHRQRESERNSQKQWPDMTIVQHQLVEDEMKQLDRLLRELDLTIPSIEFLVSGLDATRGCPEGINPNIGFRNLSFMRWNGCQIIDFCFGDTNDLNADLEQHVRMIMAFIVECSQQPMKSYFRERYNENLESLIDLSTATDWDYRPKKPSNDSAPRSQTGE